MPDKYVVLDEVKWRVMNTFEGRLILSLQEAETLAARWSDENVVRVYQLVEPQESHRYTVRFSRTEYHENVVSADSAEAARAHQEGIFNEAWRDETTTDGDQALQERYDNPKEIEWGVVEVKEASDVP